MMSSFCVVFLFSASLSKHKTFVLCLQNVLPDICKTLLTIFTNIKTLGLKAITIIFLMAFELLFSQHSEIH